MVETKKYHKYTLLALKSLRRAAAKVAEDARKNGYKIPIWRNGHIEYVIPKEDLSIDNKTDYQ